MLSIIDHNNGWPFIKDAQDIVISLDGNDNTSITSISIWKGSTPLLTFPNVTLDASGKFVFRTREILEGLNLPWIDLTSANPSIGDSSLTLRVVYNEMIENAWQNDLRESISLPWIPGGTGRPAGPGAWDYEKKFWTLKEQPIKSRMSGADWPLFFFYLSDQVDREPIHIDDTFEVIAYFTDGTSARVMITGADEEPPDADYGIRYIRNLANYSYIRAIANNQGYAAKIIDHWTITRTGIEDGPIESEYDTLTFYPDNSDGTDFIYFNSLGVPERITSMGKSAESVEFAQTLFRNRYSELGASNNSVRKMQSFSGYLHTDTERNCWMEFIESKEHAVLLENGEVKRIILDEVSCETNKFALSGVTFTWHYAEGRKGFMDNKVIRIGFPYDFPIIF